MPLISSFVNRNVSSNEFGRQFLVEILYFSYFSYFERQSIQNPNIYLKKNNQMCLLPFILPRSDTSNLGVKWKLYVFWAPFTKNPAIYPQYSHAHPSITNKKPLSNPPMPKKEEEFVLLWENIAGIF